MKPRPDYSFKRTAATVFGTIMGYAASGCLTQALGLTRNVRRSR
jgi:hypothetical protein